MIAAGIDIGTNTFRLLIAQLKGMNPGQTLAKELYSVRLGRGLAQSGVLSPAAMEKGLTALTAFRERITLFRPETCRACGTAALRLAANRDVFLEQARQILELPVDIITGQEEASLSLTGMLTFMREPLNDGLLMADVGGGSTELVFLPDAKNTKTYQSVSLPIGAVNLTEIFFEQQTDAAKTNRAADKHITDLLLTALRDLDVPTGNSAPRIVSSGGTATALATLDLGLANYDENRVQGYKLTTGNLDDIRQRLARLPVVERNLLPGLEQGRGEIILAGALIYRILLRLTGTPGMTTSDAGLLEGIMLSSVANLKKSSLS